MNRNSRPAPAQWFFTPGSTANTYRLISTRDARPL